MKKNAYQALNHYSNINKAFGGRAWNVAGKYHADGGAINTTLPAMDSRNAVNGSLLQSELLASQLRNMPAPILSITELDEKTARKNKSVRVSEL
jgi:hypothetical protein